MHKTPPRPLWVIATLTVFGFACNRGEGSTNAEGSSGDEAPIEEPTTPGMGMTVGAMDRLLRSATPTIEREGNAWVLEYIGTPVLVFADPAANRMRIVSPVIAADEVTDDQWTAIHLANFHTALDARYAVSGGVLYSLFLHPLGSLTEPDLRSALSQVVVLSRTFGATYNSTDMTFGTVPTTDSSQPSTPRSAF